MESKTSSPSPSSGNTFVPLPSGAPAPFVTPERIREQLGWALLQAGRR